MVPVGICLLVLALGAAALVVFFPDFTKDDNGSKKDPIAEVAKDDAPKAEPKTPASDYVATNCLVVLNIIEEGQAVDAMKFEGECPIGLRWTRPDNLPIRKYTDMGGRVYLLDFSKVDWEKPSQKIALYAQK